MEGLTHCHEELASISKTNVEEKYRNCFGDEALEFCKHGSTLRACASLISGKLIPMEAHPLYCRPDRTLPGASDLAACITGFLGIERDIAVVLLESIGMSVPRINGSLSFNPSATNLLLAKTPNDGSRKIQVAHQFSIPIVNLAWVLDCLRNSCIIRSFDLPEYQSETSLSAIVLHKEDQGVASKMIHKQLESSEHSSADRDNPSTEAGMVKFQAEFFGSTEAMALAGRLLGDLQTQPPVPLEDLHTLKGQLNSSQMKDVVSADSLMTLAATQPIIDTHQSCANNEEALVALEERASLRKRPKLNKATIECQHKKTRVLSSRNRAHTGPSLDHPVKRPPREALVALSGFHSAQLKTLTMQLTSLKVPCISGADSHYEWDPKITHVVASGMKSTPKILAGLAAGCWILKPSYIEASVRAGRLVEEIKHEYGGAPKHWRLTSVSAFSQKWVVIVLPDQKDRILVQVINMVVAAGGGHIVNASVARRAKCDIVVTNENYMCRGDVQRFQAQGAKCVTWNYVRGLLFEPQTEAELLWRLTAPRSPVLRFHLSEIAIQMTGEFTTTQEFLLELPLAAEGQAFKEEAMETIVATSHTPSLPESSLPVPSQDQTTGDEEERALEDTEQGHPTSFVHPLADDRQHHLLRHSLPEEQRGAGVLAHFGTDTISDAARIIKKMSQRDLQAKFRAVYGARTFSNNNNWLRRKLFEAIGLDPGKGATKKPGPVGGQRRRRVAVRQQRAHASRGVRGFNDVDHHSIAEALLALGGMEGNLDDESDGCVPSSGGADTWATDGDDGRGVPADNVVDDNFVVPSKASPPPPNTHADMEAAYMTQIGQMYGWMARGMDAGAPPALNPSMAYLNAPMMQLAMANPQCALLQVMMSHPAPQPQLNLEVYQRLLEGMATSNPYAALLQKMAAPSLMQSMPVAPPLFTAKEADL